MTSEKVRSITIYVYVGCLAVSLICVMIYKIEVVSADLNSLISQLIQLYSVPLTVIVAGVAARPDRLPVVTPTTWALLLSSMALWNILVVGILLYFLYALFAQLHSGLETSRLPVEQVVDFLSSVPQKFNFVATAPLAYFFAKSAGSDEAVAANPSNK